MAKGTNLRARYSFSMEDLISESSRDGRFDGDFQGFLFTIRFFQDISIVLSSLRFKSENDNRLMEKELNRFAKAIVPLKGTVVESYKSGDGRLGFGFLNKIQFDWFAELVGREGELFLADAYVDFGKTPSWRDYNTTKYLTLKAWVEPTPNQLRIAREKFRIPDEKGKMPTVALLYPCPPIWPPFLQDPGGIIGR